LRLAGDPANRGRIDEPAADRLKDFLGDRVSGELVGFDQFVGSDLPLGRKGPSDGERLVVVRPENDWISVVVRKVPAALVNDRAVARNVSGGDNDGNAAGLRVDGPDAPEGLQPVIGRQEKTALCS